MNTDLIFCIIFHAFNIGIAFVTLLQAFQNVNTTYIYSLFDDNSKLYSSSLHMIKRSGIQTLSQCISADSSALLLYRDAFKHNSLAHPGTKLLKWY